MIGGADGDRRLVGVASCFALSGFAALVYQVAWLAEFTVVFGTSELAVATVLATCMGGLALGAAVAARWVSRVRRAVLVYGSLEGAIAVSALCVPLLLSAASALYRLMLGGQPEPPAAGAMAGVAIAVLLPATIFIGAKLRCVRNGTYRMSESDLGTILGRIGALYALLRQLAAGGPPRASQVLGRMEGLEAAFHELLEGGVRSAVGEDPSR